MAVLERLSDTDAKKYAGQWVAVKDSHVLVAADDPTKVADWLRKNDQAADLVFRVPPEGEPTNWVY